MLGLGVVVAHALEGGPGAGHGTERVATLRQWHASSEQPIDFGAFCRGEHLASGRDRLAADMLNWVLYPDDSTHAGREMRLKQEHLLVSASLDVYPGMAFTPDSKHLIATWDGKLWRTPVAGGPEG